MVSFEQFSVEEVVTRFSLQLNEAEGIFAALPEVQPSDWLKQSLEGYSLRLLAANTEKARSEFIIAPILLEVERRYQCVVFSGRYFEVAPDEGLKGYPDFLISASTERLYIAKPIVVVVEAKREDLNGGLGQCLAEMVAAQRLNQDEHSILGAVTTGTDWLFIQLSRQQASVDARVYRLEQLPLILGIFGSFVPAH